MQKSILAPSHSITYLGVCLDSVGMRARLSRDRVEMRARLSWDRVEMRARLSWDRVEMKTRLSQDRAVAILSSLRHSGKAALVSWMIFRDCSDLGLRIQRYVIWDYHTCACCSYGWNLESRGRRGLRDVCASRSPAAASKLWCNPDLFSRGVPLCSVALRVVVTTDASTHGWGAVCEGMPASGLWLESKSRWHINRLELEAVFLALKVFQPQLEQQHVLIRTVNTSVVSYINHQGGIRSRALCKQAMDCHPLHQSSAHPRSPDPRGGHAFEEGDSSRRVEIAPRFGSDDLEPLTLRESGGGAVRHEREHALPAVLHSPLTSCWPAARPYAFPPIKKCCHWCYASISDTHCPEPALVPRLDGTAGGTALADPRQEAYAIPGGRLGVALRPGTMEPSCVIASGISEEMGALQSRVFGTLMEARTPSTRRLYTLKGVCEMVRSGSYRPGYLHHIVCSEIPAVQTG